MNRESGVSKDMTVYQLSTPSALKIAVLSVCLTVSLPSSAQMDRGQGLYENHCQECHENNVHTREKSKPKSIQDLRAWVLTMGIYSDLDWGNDEIDDLTRYLNQRIYQFPE